MTAYSSPVMTVMKCHRYLAVILGLLMVVFPTPMHCGQLSRELTHYEVLTFRMWGFFVFFLAHALKASIELGTPDLHLCLAKGLCAMFTAGSNSQHEPTIVILYILICGSLALAYGVAIVNEPRGHGKKAE